MVSLVGLIGRNRLALVVFAAGIANGACSHARRRASELGAGQWLARNARSIRLFIASLSWLSRAADYAGYRRLQRARPPRRLATAPRVLGAPSSRTPRSSLLAPYVVQRFGERSLAARL